MKPCATKQALYLEIVPLGFFFILKSHLFPIIPLSIGGGTKFHVPCAFKASNYSCIANCHCLWAHALLKVLGSSISYISTWNEKPPKKSSSIHRDCNSGKSTQYAA